LNHLYHESPTVFVCGPHWLLPDPYYPWGTTGSVPRAYIFRPTKERMGEKNKNKEMKKGKFNTK
jgi:hypothetical protein